MNKLVIKQKGLFIDILGIPSFRTPAIVDLKNLDVNIVEMELKKNGIKKYKIVQDDKGFVFESEKPKKKLIVKKQTKEVLTPNSEIIERLDQQAKILDNILRTLNLLSTTDASNSKLFFDEEKKTIKKKSKIEEVDDFIPSIDSTKIKSNVKSTKKLNVKTDLSSVKKLQELKGK